MKARRLKWFGHIVRMDEKRTVKSVRDWKPVGNKAKRIPRKRWMDDTLDDMKMMRMTNWKRNARNREVWHKHLWRKLKTERRIRSVYYDNNC